MDKNKISNTTKYSVLQKTRCISKTIGWSSFLVISMGLLLYLYFLDMIDSLLIALISFPLLIISLTKLFLNLSIIFRIVSKRYDVIQEKVLSIKVADKFSNMRDGTERKIALSNGKILVVNGNVWRRLKVGDEVVLAIVHGVKYPMLLEKK